MAVDSLGIFIERIKPAWGPLTSEVVESCRRLLGDLVKAPATDEWLTDLRRDPPEHRELYRDPTHGFLLLAHAEAEGRYRPPHDHGRGWVVYAVLQGEIDMGTYIRLPSQDGSVHLVKRDSTLIQAGQVKVFLPGDIHDTRCTKGPVLLVRFTDRDLIKEEKVERKLTRYIERDGAWAVRAA